jgi:superfamily II DNA or RNA helicase
MLDEIEKNKKGLILVYSAFRRVEGLEIFSRILSVNGYTKYDPHSRLDEKNDYKRFTFYSGVEDFKERTAISKIFTSPENKEGKFIRILLASSAGAEGLDLKNIRKVLIMEPYWHEVRIRQVVGRAVRKNSHIDLPSDQRNVKVYRYVSSLSDKQKKLSTEKLSSDEYVLRVAKKKEKLNHDVLQAVKEAAVDCTLNQCANDMKGNCFKFAGEKEGLAFLPDLSRDIVFGYEQKKTRTIKRKIVVATITDKNEIVYKQNKNGSWYTALGKKLAKTPKIDKRKKFAFDPDNLLLFDYNTLKMTGNLKQIGTVNPEGKLVS